MNAPTPAMQEKYELELKREIKKLQRIRDMMRSANNNPDMREKARYQDARKRIEVVSLQSPPDSPTLQSLSYCLASAY